MMGVKTRGSDVVPVVTIDGPGGSGKGTIAQMIATHLGWHLLDSGALYRLLALAAQHHGVDVDNEAALGVLAEHMDVQFKVSGSDAPPKAVLEGEDVTDLIRDESVGSVASIIAALPAVRKGLLQRQRAFREPPGLVADGRDMGTMVFPEADVKVFLTASPEERARRRFKQLQDKGLDVNLKRVLDEIVGRDDRDRNRVIAPLKPASDALKLDSTQMSIQAVLKVVLDEIERKCFSVSSACHK